MASISSFIITLKTIRFPPGEKMSLINLFIRKNVSYFYEASLYPERTKVATG